MKFFNALSDGSKGAVLLMLAAFGFSIMVTLIKQAGESLHVVQILFLRQLGMLLLVTPRLLPSFPRMLYSKRPWLQVSRILFALIAMLCGFTAVIHMPLADATSIGFAKSFFITIFAVILLGETVGPYRWGAVVVGFIGVLVMMKPGAEGGLFYSLLALIGAAGAGIVMVIIRIVSQYDEPITTLAYQVIGVGVVMAVPAFYYWKPLSGSEWLLIAGIAVISYYAQRANIQAFKLGEASFLASLDYVRLVYAAVLGYVIFDQLPSINTWIGSGIIILASLFTIYRENKRRQSLAQSPEGRPFTSI